MTAKAKTKLNQKSDMMGVFLCGRTRTDEVVRVRPRPQTIIKSFTKKKSV